MPKPPCRRTLMVLFNPIAREGTKGFKHFERVLVQKTKHKKKLKQNKT